MLPSISSLNGHVDFLKKVGLMYKILSNLCCLQREDISGKRVFHSHSIFILACPFKYNICLLSYKDLLPQLPSSNFKIFQNTCFLFNLLQILQDWCIIERERVSLFFENFFELCLCRTKHIWITWECLQPDSFPCFLFFLWEIMRLYIVLWHSKAQWTFDKEYPCSTKEFSAQ